MTKRIPGKVTITLTEIPESGQLSMHFDTHGVDPTDDAVAASPALMMMMLFQRFCQERIALKNLMRFDEAHKC